MKYIRLILAFTIFVIMGAKAQNSAVWEDFKISKKIGKEAVLPDFSYAGYKYSEVEIPLVNYKVFNVLDFGAIPDDTISDKNALIKAIVAATENKSGIIYFPKGKYYINTGDDELTPIKISTSNIVFRGEGTGKEGTILFFDKDLLPKNPKKLYSVPNMIEATSEGRNGKLANVIADAKRETFSLKISDASKIEKGDWVILQVSNNSKDLIEYDVQPLVIEPEWTSILDNGVVVNERHQVKSVNGNTITFFEPIHYDVQAKHNWEIFSFAHIEGIGFENIVFEGNWTKEFVHHRSAQDDGGWSILSITKSVNSWVRDCRFVNISNAITFKASAASTALNITIEGKTGHSAVSAAGGSTGILIANVNDLAGMHHASGVGGGSTTGTVVWRSKHPAHTSFESHASQPRCTLFDNVEGGFFLGRAGGASKNLPNHGRYLVLWNYKETDEAEINFEFLSSKTNFWKFVPPIIVGFHGSGTTFKTKEIQILESLGTRVLPDSLFEEQLKLRLGKLPKWIQVMER
ncbi:DUF4955 domain-containing protein [Mariniflexile ostreae]|uniref:DUF4955 domain-containing protein n=1 Tax=Mariniflexile ostreae TaxID=1520892 RepID=A0ABV5FF99_9FLAO